MPSTASPQIHGIVEPYCFRVSFLSPPPRDSLSEWDELELISELGRGAYGDVHKMREKKTGAELAVKRIRSAVPAKR